MPHWRKAFAFRYFFIIRQDENIIEYADMAELADALVLGTSGQPCRFKSCYPHQKRERLSVNFEFMEGLFYYGHLCNIQDRNATDHEQYVCSILTIEIFS